MVVAMNRNVRITSQHTLDRRFEGVVSSSSSSNNNYWKLKLDYPRLMNTKFGAENFFVAEPRQPSQLGLQRNAENEDNWLRIEYC